MSVVQSKVNLELEMKNWQSKYEQEVITHKDAVAKFTADKKHILLSSEEAIMQTLKGICREILWVVNMTSQILPQMLNFVDGFHILCFELMYCYLSTYYSSLYQYIISTFYSEEMVWAG